jgi:hypothetical protein
MDQTLIYLHRLLA